MGRWRRKFKRHAYTMSYFSFLFYVVAGFVETLLDHGAHRVYCTPEVTLLLHNGGFWINCTPKRCLHKKIGAFPNKYTKNTHFTQRLLEKSGNSRKLLCSIWKKTNITLTQNHAWHITQSG